MYVENKSKLCYIDGVVQKVGDYEYEKMTIEYQNEFETISYPWIEYSTLKLFTPSNQTKNYITLQFVQNIRYNIYILLTLIIYYYSNSNFTIIYSHSQHDSISSLLPFLFDITTILKCNIITYDYSGTGLSSGKFNEKTVNSNLQQILNFVSEIISIPHDNIILMGQSFGTIPSINLFSNIKYNKIAGLVLISPFYEHVSPKTNEQHRLMLQNIQQVKCPVFLIQGMCDKQEQVTKSEELSLYINMLYKWFPKNEKSVNLFDWYRWKFYKKFLDFIEFAKRSRQNENVELNRHVTEESRGTNNLDYARTIEKDDFLCSYRREDYKDVKMVFESMKDGGLETIIDNKH